MINKIFIFFYYLKFKYFLKFKSREKLDKYQKKRQQKIIKFAIKNSLYYRDLFKILKGRYKVITKKEFMINFDIINTVGIKLEEALELAFKSEKSRDFSKKIKNITVGLSSGTSGHRGIFLVSNKEKNIWVGAILAKCLYGSIFANYKIAFFLRADSNLYEGINSRNIIFKYFDMLNNIYDNYSDLSKFNPDILVAPPQVLIQLSNFDTSSFHLKKLISVAEVLEESDKEKIETAFNIRVDQIYQCTEGFLACSCKYGNLHINEDIVKVEKEYLDDTKTRYVPIITDLYRSSQPIIRYRLNDILVEKKGICECGLVFSIIYKIEGRQDDIFIFDSIDGKEIQIYPDYIRRCFLFTNDIIEYRIEQISKNELCIYIKTTTDNKEIREKIKKELQTLASKYNFILPNIQFKDYIHDPKNKLIRVKRLF